MCRLWMGKAGRGTIKQGKQLSRSLVQHAETHSIGEEGSYWGVVGHRVVRVLYARRDEWQEATALLVGCGLEAKGFLAQGWLHMCVTCGHLHLSFEQGACVISQQTLQMTQWVLGRGSHPRRFAVTLVKDWEGGLVFAE